MIALDCHKHYSVASVQSPEGRYLAEGRIEHHRGNIRAFLVPYSKGCPVAVETIGAQGLTGVASREADQAAAVNLGKAAGTEGEAADKRRVQSDWNVATQAATPGIGKVDAVTRFDGVRIRSATPDRRDAGLSVSLRAVRNVGGVRLFDRRAFGSAEAAWGCRFDGGPSRADRPWRKAEARRSSRLTRCTGDGRTGVGQLRRLLTGVDEPYQHFQFAGRADVTAGH
jgi:hypothetical protein